MKQLLTFLKNNKQTISFAHLWDWTDKLAKVAANSNNIITDMSEFVAPLLNISTEGGLQREIKDVIDELDIMIYINKQQSEVLKKFVKNVGNLLDPEKPENNKFDSSTSPSSPTSPTSPNFRFSTEPTGSTTSNNDTREARIRRNQYNHRWFNRTAQELLEAVDDRIRELNGLKRSAESTSKSVCQPSTDQSA